MDDDKITGLRKSQKMKNRTLLDLLDGLQNLMRKLDINITAE
jgi:hypothetical protein